MECIVNGVPPHMKLKQEEIQVQLVRRRPGQADAGATRKIEADAVQILSGTEKGVTPGTPIGMFVKNKDMRPHDYGDMSQILGSRTPTLTYQTPLTYQTRYGFRATSGGGRSSARETIERVAVGFMADKFLKERYGVEIVSWVSAVWGLVSRMTRLTRHDFSRACRRAHGAIPMT